MAFPLLTKRVKMIPIPLKKAPVLALAIIRQYHPNPIKITKLTSPIRSIINIQQIVRNSTSQISNTQPIERLIVQFGIIASQHRSSKET